MRGPGGIPRHVPRVDGTCQGTEYGSASLLGGVAVPCSDGLPPLRGPLASATQGQPDRLQRPSRYAFAAGGPLATRHSAAKQRLTVGRVTYGTCNGGTGAQGPCDSPKLGRRAGDGAPGGGASEGDVAGRIAAALEASPPRAAGRALTRSLVLWQVRRDF